MMHAWPGISKESHLFSQQFLMTLQEVMLVGLVGGDLHYFMLLWKCCFFG